MTDVEICNLALAHLGEAPISSLSDDTTAGRACNQLYLITRDAVLRSHRWNFAVAPRVTLSTGKVTISSVADSGGLVRINKTAHGLATGKRVLLDGVGSSVNQSWLVTRIDGDAFTLDGSVYVSGLTAGTYREVPVFGWAYFYTLPDDCLRVLEVNDSEGGDNSGEWVIEGGKLLCNADTLNLLYLRKVEDETLFEPLFIEAFAIKLATAASEIIRGATGKTEQLATNYERVTAPLARRVDSNEARRRKPLRPVNSQAIRARLGIAWQQ